MKLFLQLLLVVFCCGFILCQMLNSRYGEADYRNEDLDRYNAFYDDDPNYIQKRVQFLRLGKRLARKSANPYVG
ncbi:unnamed protein product [Schistosoma rodhaini]|uniref:Pre-mRNA-splicing factor SYF2 n=1 Tax=Schistosoma rodhaini TaxID=6188 RepID=A0AA85FQ49_9TREM|nr:unnamed protein product [Schistosoma rodhaini]CAH8563213.1 unnamed protein product [Schistosoma rodhaini]